MEQRHPYSPWAILEFDDDGIILDVNDTVMALTGRHRDDLIGSHFATMLSPGGRVFYQTHFYPTLRMHGTVEEVHFDVHEKGDSSNPVLAYAVRQDRGKRFVNSCLFVPARQRSRYEEELRQAKGAAEAAHAKQARSLAMVSHDLRAPLQTIFSHLLLLGHARRGTLNAEQTQDLAMLRNAAKEMKHLLDSLMTFAQLEGGSIEPRRISVRVTDVVARAEGLIAARIDDCGLTYTQSVPDDDVAVQADPDRLHQVLVNLLTNAMKFTPPGGSISVKVEHDESVVLFHVQDTGCGIPAHLIEQIFDPFVQVDQKSGNTAQGGIGLGLAISRELTRAMGGEILLRSEVGIGSVFTVRLRRTGVPVASEA